MPATGASLTRPPVDETPKPCHHPIAQHQHGTRVCYVHDHCRCAPCRASSATYEQNRIRQHAYGRWDNLVDAGPVREHLKAVMAQGVGRRRVSQLAGMSASAVSNLVWGKRRSDGEVRPTARVRQETADRLLAIQASPAGGALVPATGAARRVQALVALGWSQARVSIELEYRSPSQLTALALGRLEVMTARHDREVRAVYDRLSMQLPPQTNQRERISVSRARAYAKRRGWLPPLAWDDGDLDDPETSPEALQEAAIMHDTELDEAAIYRRMHGDKTVRLSKADAAELVARCTAAGWSLIEIAQRTGIRPERYRQAGAA